MLIPWLHSDQLGNLDDDGNEDCGDDSPTKTHQGHFILLVGTNALGWVGLILLQLLLVVRESELEQDVGGDRNKEEDVVEELEVEHHPTKRPPFSPGNLNHYQAYGIDQPE